MSIARTISPHLRESKESETLLINQLSLSLQSEKKKVYKFGFGQSPFPVPEHVVEAMSQAAFRKEYMAVQGFLPLRESISEFHKDMEGRHWRQEDIIIGSGSKILLYCIMASFTRAHVLIPSPSWVSYAPQADLAGHKVHWLDTSFDKKWKLSTERLDDACSKISNSDIPKLLVLNYPSNPTGQTYSDTELEELAQVCRKHNIIVIADEIYGFLDFSGTSAHLSKYYPEGVLTTSGLSKWCGAGGWRLGYLHVPETLTELNKRVIGIASETYSCAASPVQLGAIAAFLEFAKARDFLRSQRDVLQQASDLCARKLQRVGVQVWPAEGGFYLFPDFSAFKNKLAQIGISTSPQLMARILEQTGVALLPGSAFGMPDDSLTARLAFVDFDGAEALNTSDLSFVLKHCEDGIDALCGWLNSI